jgi:SAM-dependent methyltransferase
MRHGHALARLAIQEALLDFDGDALPTVEQQCRQRQLGEVVKTLRKNVAHSLRGTDNFGLNDLDLAYSVGLFDYLDDRPAVALIDRIYDTLWPGGEIIVGNFHPNNQSRGMMEAILDWLLIHRTEDDMDRLFLQSKFGRPSEGIITESAEINLFACCRKPGARAVLD